MENHAAPQLGPFTVADGVNAGVGKLRHLGGGFWHLSFDGFEDIVPTEALGALIHGGFIVCACRGCAKGAR